MVKKLLLTVLFFPLLSLANSPSHKKPQSLLNEYRLKSGAPPAVMSIELPGQKIKKKIALALTVSATTKKSMKIIPTLLSAAEKIKN